MQLAPAKPPVVTPISSLAFKKSKEKNTEEKKWRKAQRKNRGEKQLAPAKPPVVTPISSLTFEEKKHSGEK